MDSAYIDGARALKRLVRAIDWATDQFDWETALCTKRVKDARRRADLALERIAKVEGRSLPSETTRATKLAEPSLTEGHSDG
ncbi:hypothetical protein GJ689_24825 [Rhodoplanes serenus]|uniref:Uncharacterized protein n=1 Tax=Rhodoplanes serenus TaxID=200615 RepID=A0A9X4XRV0_9BRAD|nr:hypothetical protein [Rhodoplanes serenus]MTW19419.1 hypothetical protein [Rhodoplanes serenus]